MPEASPERITVWLNQLPKHQRAIVKGRIMYELRLGWSTLHERLANGFPEEDHDRIRSIFSDYLYLIEKKA